MTTLNDTLPKDQAHWKYRSKKNKSCNKSSRAIILSVTHPVSITSLIKNKWKQAETIVNKSQIIINNKQLNTTIESQIIYVNVAQIKSALKIR